MELTGPMKKSAERTEAMLTQARQILDKKEVPGMDSNNFSQVLALTQVIATNYQTAMLNPGPIGTSGSKAGGDPAAGAAAAAS